MKTITAADAKIADLIDSGQVVILGSSEELLSIVEMISRELENGSIQKAIVFKVVPTRFPSGILVKDTSYTISGHSFAQDPKSDTVARNLVFAITQWSGRETALKVTLS